MRDDGGRDGDVLTGSAPEVAFASSPPMTASVRAIDSTRTRVIEAAVDLIHLQGYNATSLRQIADRVGLQVGSLYNHISSKEALLFEIMRGVLDELIADTEREMAEAGPEPLARALAFFRTSIRFHALRRKETFIGNTELRGLSEEHRAEIVQRRDRYETLLRGAFTACQEEGCIEVEDVQLATRAALALCTSIATWYRPGGRLSLDDLQARLPALFAPFARMAAAT